MKNTEKDQNIVVFRPKGSKITVEVHLTTETVWLSQKQMAGLFDKDVRTINEHILNIFKEKELRRDSVIRKFRITASDGKSYETAMYNLDVIISVGYRVSSQRGTQFRIWATSVLRQYLIKGYTVNEKRLKDHAASLKTLQKTVQMLADLSERKALTSEESKSLFQVIRDYSYGLDVLDDYDHGRVEIKSATAKESYQLTYEEAIQLIHQMKKKFGASALFGRERINRLRVR